MIKEPGERWLTNLVTCADAPSPFKHLTRILPLTDCVRLIGGSCFARSGRLSRGSRALERRVLGRPRCQPFFSCRFFGSVGHRRSNILPVLNELFPFGCSTFFDAISSISHPFIFPLSVWQS